MREIKPGQVLWNSFDADDGWIIMVIMHSDLPGDIDDGWLCQVLVGSNPKLSGNVYRWRTDRLMHADWEVVCDVP